MAGTTRIRWEETHHGFSFAGYVGTYEPWVFRVYLTEQGWRVGSRFPGVVGEAERGTGPDELKERCEEWLVRFLASIGAVFPEPELDGQLPRQPLIHDLAIVLAGALHPGVHLPMTGYLASDRLRAALDIGDGDPVYGRELTGAKDVEAKLSAALGVTRIAPPEDGD
jgi:hypothetical protein